MNGFFQVTLRTTDVDAARAFHRAVLGDRRLDVVPLHEQALARGARPHWLGMIDVGDVDAASAAFVEAGATPLARWTSPEGLEASVLRDPGGAIVALATPKGPQPALDVGWYVLHTADVARAKVDYGRLGWAFGVPQDAGEHGVLHPFSWEPGAAIVGFMRELRPGVHPHWLFHFRVPALEPAMDAVRANGGRVLGPFELPSGERTAVCDDAQGAAFGLCETTRARRA